jgi:S-DNA-T family DNA segregation ATPase FtsK/SpoIIIE
MEGESEMRKLLEYQADRIEAVLAQHKAPGRVTGGTVTPRWVRFKVLPAMGSRISTIQGLAEELATALDAPSVRVARQGAALQVEVPRQDAQPVRLLPLREGLRDVPEATAVLGLADDGAPLLIRLTSPDVAHILVAGTTGSGKTALAADDGVEPGDAPSQPPGAAAGADRPQGAAFVDMAGLPQLARPVVTRVEEAVEALGSLVRLMEQRDHAGQSRPVVAVFIDELTDLMMVGGREAELRLTRLLQRGREAGIHIIAATQKPTAAVIGSLVKANFPVRLVGKVTSPEDARVASGWKGTGAERLLGRGDFIAVAEGRLHRFQAAYVSAEETAQVVAWLQEEEGRAGQGWVRQEELPLLAMPALNSR